MTRTSAVLVLLALLMSACGGSGGAAPAASSTPGPSPAVSPGPDASPSPQPSPLRLEDLVTVQATATRLNLSQALDLQFGPDGMAYIVEQAGTIQRFDPNGDGADAVEFLDIRSRVAEGGEMGLLGLALHPEFATNGQFFVHYTQDNPRQSVIARFESDGSRADVASELEILRIDQPFSNHNAGSLAFGPVDGLLYVPLGDGGSGGDPNGHGQNLQTLLGSILRLDINRSDAGRNYRIPQDNPFFGNTAGIRQEIYAFGLRNPFKISFDSPPGEIPQLWAADVGQDRLEEVNLIRAGGNYGWNIMEGSACFSPAQGCSSAGLEMPLTEYGRELGRSVTGGYVYRGERIPELTGHYIFGDFVSGRMFALNPQSSEGLIVLAELNLPISSFGRDAAGEIYIVDYTGALFKLIRR